MQELLKYIDGKYFTNLGEYKLSCLSEVSIGLSMIYLDKLKKGLESKPLIIGYPNKKWATVWLSIGLLNNLFYTETLNLNENWIEQLNLKKNDKIELFGKPSRWLGKVNGKWNVQVSQSFRNSYDKTEKSIIPFRLPDAWVSFVNRDTSNRTSIVSISALNKELKKRRGNRSALEEILLHTKSGKDLGINSKRLQSKVLIVTGRGDKGRFIRQLNDTEIYGEPLDKVFGLGRNLIVEVDLEKYKSIADPTYERESFSFKGIVLKGLSWFIKTEPDLESRVEKLQSRLTKNDYLNESFISEFNDLIDEADDENQYRLRNLIKKHPGVKLKSDYKFQAIVINDASILKEYKATIQQFLKEKIPVIVLTDFYSEFDVDDIEDDTYYRFFWGNSKLNYFSNEKSETFLDAKLWKLAKRFNKQFVTIEISDDAGIEEWFSQLTRSIYGIEGFEIIKELFWSSLFPVFHLIKNTPGNIPFSKISELLKEFREEVKRTQLPAYQGDRLKKIMSILESGFINPKNLTSNELVYKQLIPGKYVELEVPDTEQLVNKFAKQITSDTQSILFTGEPYKEKYIGQLKKACISNFASDVKILCWPNEGKKITNYLTQSYLSKYFTDNFSQIFKINDKYEIKNKKEIETEVNEIICIDSGKFNEPKLSGNFDDLFDKLREYSHASYKSKNNDESVIANILTFTNGDWMYLPKNSSLLAANYLNDGKLKIRKYKFNELTPGLQIIQYNLSRHQLRTIARGKYIVTFEQLDNWRVALENSFKKSGEDYKVLEAELNRLKNNNHESNPSKTNLVRWRNDDELLAPNNANLELILLSDKKEHLLKKVSDARILVRRFDSDIRSKIKSGILLKLESIIPGKTDTDSFDIDVRGFTVRVSPRTILSKENQTIEVSYSSTRKIISD